MPTRFNSKRRRDREQEESDCNGIAARTNQMRQINIAPGGLLDAAIHQMSQMRISMETETDPAETETEAPPKERPYQIFVRNMFNITRTFDVNPRMPVLTLKQLVFEREGLPVQEQRLIYAGKQLQDRFTLEDYNVCREATLHLVFRLRGG